MNELCRLCLNKEESLRHIYKEKLYCKIMACASIQVWEFDGLPKHICTNCYIKLELSFQFKKRCEETDKILRTKYLKPDESDRNEECGSPDVQMFSNADVYTIDIKNEGGNDNIDVVKVEDEEATEINVHNMTETATDINLDIVITKTNMRNKIEEEEEEEEEEKKPLNKRVVSKKKIAVPFRRKLNDRSFAEVKKKSDSEARQEAKPIKMREPVFIMKKSPVKSEIPPPSLATQNLNFKLKPMKRALPSDITVIPIKSKLVQIDGDALKSNLKETLNKLFKFKQVVRPYEPKVEDKTEPASKVVEAKIIKVDKIEKAIPSPAPSEPINESPQIDFSIDDETMHELKYEDILQAEGILDMDSEPIVEKNIAKPEEKAIEKPVDKPIEEPVVSTTNKEVDVEENIPGSLIRVDQKKLTPINDLIAKPNEAADPAKSKKVILYVKQKVNGTVVFKRKRIIVKGSTTPTAEPFVLQKVTQNMNNFCKICKKYFKTSETLEEHTLLHEKKVCPVCDKKFGRIGFDIEITAHLKKHSYTSMRYKCETCNELFTYFTKYETHLEAHTIGKEYYSCTECNNQFRVINEMKRHMKSKHEGLDGELLYGCVVCKESFYTSGELKIHVRRHRFVHRYVCSVCNEQMAEPAQLTEHLRTHLRTEFYAD